MNNLLALLLVLIILWGVAESQKVEATRRAIYMLAFIVLISNLAVKYIELIIVAFS